jgi:hypothetical protein
MRVAAVGTFAGGEIARWDFVGLGVAIMVGGAFVLKRGLA